MSDSTEKGRVAVVTGASSGIGAAAARALATDLSHPRRLAINEILLRPAGQP